MSAIEDLKAKTPTTSVSEVTRIRDFFDNGGLLTQACRELGLEYQTVRRNLNGRPGDIKLSYAVMLGEWVRQWEAQTAERVAISEGILQ